MLFNRAPEDKIDTMKHTTLATARLRFLFDWSEEFMGKLWLR
jgi:hypothetical protein